ncbi:MAG: hypothetical protein ACODAJ_00335, partial [Planctomycetota bacterium]
MVRTVAVMALEAVVLLSPALRAGQLAIRAPRKGLAQGRLAELIVEGIGDCANPFDPAVVTLDAEVATPGGRTLGVPGFYRVPQEAKPQERPKRLVKHLRLFFGARHYRKGTRLELLLDDVALVDRDTGERMVVDAFEGPLRWKKQGCDVLRLDGQRAHGGGACLRVAVTVGEGRKWPGTGMDLGGADWT